MRKLWLKIGRLTFWLAYPALWVYLRNSQRTRVVVLNDKHEILLVKGWLSASPRWNLPGGGLHKHEIVAAGALRELREETGLALGAGDLKKLGAIDYAGKGFKVHLQYYVARVEGRPAVRMQPLEIVEARWVPLSALNLRNADPDVLLPLERWLKGADFVTM